MKKTLLILILCLAPVAKAEFLRTPYPGVRPMGMGNAFLAISDDNNALWYNPAALARVKSYNVSLLDTSLGVDSVDTFNRIYAAIFQGDFNNLVRPDQQYMRVNLRPTFLMPYFSLSFFSHGTSFMRLSNLTDLNANVDLYGFNDVGVAAGVGIPLGPYLSVGATVRGFQRTGIDAVLTGVDLLMAMGLPVTPPSQAQVISAVFQQVQTLMGGGLGLGLDLGMLFQVPLPKGYPKWSLAAVVDDFGKTTFRPFLLTNAPKRVDTTIHFGTALQYELGKYGQFNLSFDYRNAFESVALVKQLNLGVEYRQPKFGLRGGLSQGYLTFGASIEFPPSTRIHFSSSASELGASLWQQEYRVFMMQIAIGFNPS